MKDRVNIRELTFSDAAAVQQIRKAISEEDGDVNFEKLIEQQTSDGRSQSGLVAEMNNNVVGYMIHTTLYAGFGIKKSGWIMAMGVHPDHMGQGIGLELANKLCEIYKEKGIHSIYSAVRWDSTDVLSFFKKLGFGRSEFINLKKNL